MWHYNVTKYKNKFYLIYLNLFKVLLEKMQQLSMNCTLNISSLIL